MSPMLHVYYLQLFLVIILEINYYYYLFILITFGVKKNCKGFQSLFFVLLTKQFWLPLTYIVKNILFQF